MFPPLRCRILVVTYFGIATAACSQEADVGTGPQSLGLAPPPQPTLSIQGRFGVPTPDSYKNAISLQAPGFAGMFWEPAGRLRVRATSNANPSDVVAALQDSALTAAFLGVRDAIDEARVRLTLDAEYGFASLTAWRDELTPALYQGGVVYSSIDDVRNAIRIGVINEEVGHRINQAAQGLGIPAGALNLEYNRSVQPAQDLRDRFRPIPGGVEIGPAGCSVGANAFASGVGDGFVTASHCSSQFWSLDGDDFHQPDSESDLVGTEWSDPGPLISCGAPNGCRYSDASFVRYVSDFAELGYIARTEDLGSRTIDFWNPRFTIAAADGWVQVGATVQRMGRTEGWTAGEVTDDCVDYPDWVVPGYTLLCQTEMTAIANPGDSGGPAFTWDFTGSDVTLVGIIVSRILHNGETVGSGFSNWTYVDFEIGSDVGPLTVIP